MKKSTRHLLKSRTKPGAKSKKTSALQARNIFTENARKLLSGDINFFNKMKERNLRRRLTAVTV